MMSIGLTSTESLNFVPDDASLPHESDDALQEIRDDGAALQTPSHFAVIAKQRLWQECLSHSIRMLHPEVSLSGYPTIASYFASRQTDPVPNAIVLNFNQDNPPEADVFVSIRHLVTQVDPIPVVVLSDSESINQMLSVLDCGARGYIPASIGLDAIVEAMKTAASGGFVFTGKGLDLLRQQNGTKPDTKRSGGSLLTSRQSAVAEALRQGKPNKIIAYELQMCENTVKVHVRNILQKLNVTNRTEAAYKLNESVDLR